MYGLHGLKIDNGIFLDEKRLYGIREYSVVQNEGDNQATLTIKMDVTFLGDRNDTHIVKKMDSLESVARPVIEFLNENYNPHTTIIITSDRVVVTEDVLSIPCIN